eukprot:11800167-Ditylum_brightwellii.AAC.1
MRIKACTWLDNLRARLDDTFDYEEVDNVTTDEGKIMRSYRSVVSKYSKDASTTYNEYFASLNIDIENDNNTENDTLVNVWTKPPKVIYRKKSSISQGDNLSSTLGAEEGQNNIIARLLKRTEALEQSQQEHRQEVKANKEIINTIRKE